MLDFEFHCDAAAELEEAYRWYLARSPDAAMRFLEKVDASIDASCLYPERWSRYLHGTRIVRLDRYPYGLVYMAEPDRVLGVAVAHLKRRPGYWKDRLED